MGTSLKLAPAGEFVSDTRGITARKALEDASGLEDEIAEALLVKYKSKIISNVDKRIYIANKDEIQFSLLNTSSIPLHSSTQIDDIIQNGFQKGLALDEIEGLLFISYKIDKQITSSELIDQIYLLEYLRKIRKFPYEKFNTIDDYNDFKDDFKILINDYDLPINDIRVQGSSLRKTNPDDTDIAIMIDEDEVEQIRDKLLKRAEKHYDDSEKNYKKFIRNLDKDIQKGKIPYGRFGKLENNNNTFMQDLYDRGIYPQGEKLNISIIIKNKQFDVPPYLKF